MAEPKLRRAVRLIVFDESDRVLLCRFDLPEHGVVVWTPPGGGVELGESAPEALRREMAEEVGLVVAHPLPHVWHQRVVAEGHATGYDGVINDYYLLKTEAFAPRGTLGDEALRRENIAEFRWWNLEELRTYRGQAVFAPRALPQLLTDLLLAGAPNGPLEVGL